MISPPSLSLSLLRCTTTSLRQTALPAGRNTSSTAVKEHKGSGVCRWWCRGDGEGIRKLVLNERECQYALCPLGSAAFLGGAVARLFPPASPVALRSLGVWVQHLDCRDSPVFDGKLATTVSSKPGTGNATRVAVLFAQRCTAATTNIAPQQQESQQ